MKKLVIAFALAATVQSQAMSAESPLERGTYLMKSIVACGNCHTPQTPAGPAAGMELAGQFLIEEPGLFKVFAPNITQDKETGIGNWTDEQIIAAIREGKRPDGTIIGPPMPIEQYRNMSDTDVKAIVAYLRQVTPVKNVVEKSIYQIPLPPSYGPPVTQVPDVPRADIIAYGAYLAGPAGHCIECHSPMANGKPDVEHQLGAGGLSFPGPWGVSISANITPHEDGIAHYSDAELETVIRTGVRPDGSRLLPPMGVYYYANITEEDMAALIAYLRQIEPKPSPK
ncbi:c-type cytochrome [Sneathiella chungangensis]|uniref:C-type cytochrome n=1 Tax=Sneathiella chungangensis TaxID=1418234 RepID=A0A845MFW3_9PROT|nr:c-type cytochrome [Sneathiella chungangensis]MZR22340.1 c-type cytochrome [Sneathiella chungangensis]